jgi:hypothetical protein
MRASRFAGAFASLEQKAAICPETVGSRNLALVLSVGRLNTIGKGDPVWLRGVPKNMGMRSGLSACSVKY